MLRALTDLVFPKICYSCGKNLPQQVNLICVGCRNDLAKLNIREFENNPIQQIFWGRLDLQKATAFLKFEKNGKLQHLLHALKYKSAKEIGIILGEMAALQIGETEFFKSIDALLPVPIHKLKAAKRGYNQSDYIALGIANITNVQLAKDQVRKVINTSSQTKKSRYERYKNVTKTFEVANSSYFENKHVLIIDDVVTTGATVEALGNELAKIKGVKISLLTIAYTN